MKKIIILLLVSGFSHVLIAQSYRHFRVGIGGGFAAPPGSGAKAGAAVYVEPAYRISPSLTVGLRVEVAVVERGNTFSNVNTDVFKGNNHGLSSLTLNAQYYFRLIGVRPFVGVGTGIFSFAAAQKYYYNSKGQTTVSSSNIISGGSKAGVCPRIGFDYNHFVFTLEYNIVPGNSTTTYNSTTTTNGVSTYDTQTSTIQNGYFAVKVGFCLGGGRR